MSNSKKGIKAKISNLIPPLQKFFTGRTQTPPTEKEQQEQAYANYRASQELSTRYPAKNTTTTLQPKTSKYRAYLSASYSGKEIITRKTVAPVRQAATETRLTVPDRTVKSKFIDPVLYKLTGGKYGIIDILEDDATSLVTA